MYLSILLLPLLGSIISGLMGRKIGVTGSHIITCTCLILSSVLATLAFYEVGLCGSPVVITLVNWIDSDYMSINWEFLFDQLTVSMFNVSLDLDNFYLLPTFVLNSRNNYRNKIFKPKYLFK